MKRSTRIEWFKLAADKLPEENRTAYDLLLNAKVDSKSFQAMKEASVEYLKACMQSDEESDPDAFLSSITNDRLSQLANRTPNGAVLPKMEVAAEFNKFHRSVSSWFQSLGLDETVYQVFCPTTLRIMHGAALPDMEKRPYATNKMHADLWAGDPADGVNIIITLFGDFERTSVEFFQPPQDFEEKFMRHLDSYDEGYEYTKNCPQYKFSPSPGTVTFFDSIVPHKTVRKGGEARGTIQFNIRRKTSAESLAHIESVCDQGKLVNFIPLEDWYAIGDTKFLKFTETLADAKQGIFSNQPYSNSFYTFADRL